MKPLSLIFLVLFLILVSNCEQYIGYKYDVSLPDNSIAVYGTVQNTFTGDYVDSALVEIGNQKTYTDVFGAFRIIHEIKTDDERNRPVSVNVSAKNYLPYTNSFIIYQEDIQRDISLDYAAPVIDSSYVSTYLNTRRLMCHVFLHDYQGNYDIRLVRGSFFYEKDGEHVYKQLDLVLTVRSYPSTISAEYTVFVPIALEGNWTLISRGFFYYIYVEDYEGYSIRKRFK